MNWNEAERIHAKAASDFAEAAQRVPAAVWLAPRAEGKWSPAEIVEHVGLSYDTLNRELAGGPGMALRTKLWQRILLRFTLVPRLLRGAPFPKGARAPKETRPAVSNPDQAAAIAAFRVRAAAFEAAASAAQKANRGQKLTHAYFGRASLTNSVLLCARHVEHHLAQLRALQAEPN